MNRSARLDALTREKMQGLVAQLWKETAKTSILITHSSRESAASGRETAGDGAAAPAGYTRNIFAFAEMGVGRDPASGQEKEPEIQPAPERNPRQ